MSVRLAVEALAARAAARLSRAAGRGGGTTIPGKLLWKLDPGAIDRLAARLPQGAALVSATNGKTTTSAMAAAILGRGRRLAWNRSGANLVSGVASTLLAARDAELGLLEVDEGALPEVVRRVRPRAVCSATSSATSSTATASSSSSPSAGARPRRSSRRDAVARRQRRRPAGRRPRARAGRNGRVRARRPAPRPSRAAARRRLEVVHPLRASVRVRRGLRRAPRRLPLPGLRPRPARRSRSRARDRAARAAAARRSRSSRPPGSTRIELPLPGLYNVYNARRRRGARPGARRAARRDSRRPRALRRGVRAVRADRGRRPRDPDAADQESGRRERGRADARATAALRRSLLIALNDAIADGQDVSWIWDVDLEPLLAGARARWSLPATGPPSSRMRCVYGGLSAERARGRAGSRRRRSTAASSSRRRAASSSSSPRTRRCSSCADRRRARARCARTGSAA